MSQSIFRWFVALVVSAFAISALVSPALVFGYGEGVSPAIMCAVGTHAAEVGANGLPLEPANGATVPAGTPVVFSAESLLHNAPTFNVASSPSLLSSPDIDSGTGSQSGVFYRFTSTKATVIPRTIYWTASFTFTVEGCESPSTFTTPVRRPYDPEVLARAVADGDGERAARSGKGGQGEAAAFSRQVFRGSPHVCWVCADRWGSDRAFHPRS